MKKTLLSAAIASILLTPAYAEQLDPIVVTANNLEQPLSSVTSPTFVITREEIDERGWETLADALKTVPSISFSRSGGQGTLTTVRVRGQNGKGILFMIDGQMIADPSNTTLSPQIENITLDQIERIEVVLGPQSGVWGSNASAGVINIITRQAGHQSLIVEGGSENTRRINAVASRKTDQFSLLASISSFNTEGYTAVKKYGTSGKHDEKDGFQQDDILMKATVSPHSGHTLGMSVEKTRATGELDDENNPNQTAGRYERELLNQRAWYAFTSGRLKLKLGVVESTIERTSYSAWGPYSAQGNLTEWNGQLGYTYAPHSTLQLSAANQRVQGNNDAYWHDAVGLTHVHQLGGLQLTEALRSDHFDKFKDATTGKVGFKWPVGKSFSIQGNYGTSYNSPTPFQLGYGETQNLKPESSEGWDLGVSALGATLTYYEQSLKDALVYGGTWPNDYYTNADGKQKFSGWEFSYSRGWGDWHASLNYAWLNARDENGTFLARVPHDKGTLTLDYYGINKWHVGTEINHVSDYYNSQGSSGTNLGNYTTVDVKADYNINRHFNVYARAINLFDVDYYTATQNYQEPPQYGYNTGGFQWRVGLRGKF